MNTIEVLRGIWAEVLDEDDIADDDNFLAIGGDSLLALEVASRARALGLDLANSAVLRKPVLCDLASAVDSR